MARSLSIICLLLALCSAAHSRELTSPAHRQLLAAKCKPANYVGQLVKAPGCPAEVTKAITKCQSKQLLTLAADCSISGRPAQAAGCPQLPAKASTASTTAPKVYYDAKNNAVVAGKYVLAIFKADTMVQPIVNMQGTVVCTVEYKIPSWKP